MTGDAILLQYGPQGAQQAGDAIILSAIPAEPVAGAVRAIRVAPWRRQQSSAVPTRAPYDQVAVLDDASTARWPAGAPLRDDAVGAWGTIAVLDDARQAPWDTRTERQQIGSSSTWQPAVFIDDERAAPWLHYTRQPMRSMGSRWLQGNIADDTRTSPWLSYATHRATSSASMWRMTVSADDGVRAPWNSFTRILQPGWGVVTETNEPPTNENGTIVTPTIRTYVMVNEISLMRQSNALYIPAFSLSIDGNADSWTWDWSAVIPYTNLDDVRPENGQPVELRAVVNGWEYGLLVEHISTAETLKGKRVTISGRGLGAELSAPWAIVESRSNTSPRDASQLCEDALLINGVPASGWTIDFNLTDWLVATGAWVSHASPIDAIAGIAAAAGGYIRPARVDRVLHIEPRYPTAPWAWNDAIPDYELPHAAVSTLSVEYVSAEEYNAVYVAGTGPGAILAQVKRQGSAANRLAQMITDPLITEPAAARQRGLSVLGYTGSIELLTVQTPILDMVGPYPVGSLVQIGNRLGMVRSNRLAMSYPSVRQILEVECHA